VAVALTNLGKTQMIGGTVFPILADYVEPTPSAGGEVAYVF